MGAEHQKELLVQFVSQCVADIQAKHGFCSDADVAELVKLSPDALRDLMTGKTTDPGFSPIAALAQKAGRDLNEATGITAPMNSGTVKMLAAAMRQVLFETAGESDHNPAGAAINPAGAATPNGEPKLLRRFAVNAARSELGKLGARRIDDLIAQDEATSPFAQRSRTR